MDALKVSVIMPVYNAQKYLRHSLEQLFGQTLKNIEIICIDDGSTDQSLRILQEYAKKDSRLIVVHQHNQGAGPARNKGISLAKGTFLSLLDADDFFEPNMLEEMVIKAEKTQADITICRSVYYHEITKETSAMSYALVKEYLPLKEVFNYQDIPQHIFGFCFGWAWDKLYRHDFVKKHQLKFQSLQNTNDMFFVFLSLVKADSITIVDQILIKHRGHVNSSLSRTREKSFLCFYEALRALKEGLLKTQRFDVVEQSFVNWGLAFCLWQLGSLKYPQKYFLYQKCRKEIFKTLGFDEKKEEYFYQKIHYQQMKEIIEHSFLMYAMKKIYQKLMRFLKKI